MRDEDLVKKVERLEFYIQLLRDFAVEPEAFVLWDYVMTEELDGEQTNRLMNILGKHKGLIWAIDEQTEPYSDQTEEELNVLEAQLKPLFQSFKNPHPTDRDAVLRVVRRAAKLPEMILYKRM
ncbi:hypothetical protein Sgly_1195 [Syntrophobotulus glycolicus DSM 8271]|uniref:Uncharacterized protein n=1 Tax=Syntrophobotulus glycolicus (strain DSM 8271 / FlGlyR) TaxID=645991 RepID=F0SUM0_SYNGF|nr:hypothetical protein [Syntrophobotulus glycolicus]ADY55513.1 hypothetical protein Sgly_1195 [Syntrophobotulus glycolicus DSM 8271]